MRSKLFMETGGRLWRNWFPLLPFAMVFALCFYPSSTHAQNDQKDRQKAHRTTPPDWGASLIALGRRGAGTINDRLDTLHFGYNSADGARPIPQAAGGPPLNAATVNSSCTSDF